MNSPLTLVILSAGEGKRLKPLITSKGLLPFCGQPITRSVIQDFKTVGVNRVLVITSPQQQSAYQSALNSLSGIKLSFASQPRPSGMADALLAAADQIKSQPIIVVNSTDIRDIKRLKKFVGHINSKKPAVLLEGLKLDRYLPGGWFKLKKGKVVGIVEKPQPGKEPSPYYNTVLHYFSQPQEFIRLLKSSRSSQDDLYEVALDQLIKQGQVDFLPATGYYAVIKYPHHLLDVMEVFLQHRLQPGTHSSAKIHPTAVVSGPVQIEANVTIMPHAVIQGPAYLGPHVTVGNNALIRQSIIENHSVVGYNTEIARSYVGPHNWFHCNYVGDSVIEGHSNLGSGARLANFRFDEQEIFLKKDKDKISTQRTKFGAVLGQGAKLGINASIMPGVTIGDHSLIASGLVLNQAISPHQSVFLSPQPTIKTHEA